VGASLSEGPITATFDRRVIDGYQAAKLGQTFKKLLEDPATNLAVRPRR
jgi:pyruvate/2-oxoglutarate dehydrogenase complex dihydrolipoamide acyltransferase (E2) component